MDIRITYCNIVVFGCIFRVIVNEYISSDVISAAALNFQKCGVAKMNHKQELPEALSVKNGAWILFYRPEKISEPWSVLDTFDNRLSAIIKAHQVSHDYFMVKVTDSHGSIAWSN